MIGFRPGTSNHLGGLLAGRSLMKLSHDFQMNKAYQTKDKGDFEEAAKTQHTMNIIDVLMGLLRLGR